MTSRKSALANWGVGVLGLSTILACFLVGMCGRYDVPAAPVVPGGLVLGLVPAFGIIRGLKRHVFDKPYDWIWLVLSIFLSLFFLMPAVASLWNLITAG